MARERFAEEFKSEAVRQVVERGYSVADVAKRLGVSPRMAISILNKQFIKSVSGPGIDDGRQVLFLRTEALERIFIEVRNEEQLPMELS